MSVRAPTRSRLRLDRESYRGLKTKILERDAWKCQHCGRRDNFGSITLFGEASREPTAKKI